MKSTKCATLHLPDRECRYCNNPVFKDYWDTCERCAELHIKQMVLNAKTEAIYKAKEQEGEDGQV